MESHCPWDLCNPESCFQGASFPWDKCLGILSKAIKQSASRLGDSPFPRAVSLILDIHSQEYAHDLVPDSPLTFKRKGSGHLCQNSWQYWDTSCYLSLRALDNLFTVCLMALLGAQWHHGYLLVIGTLDRKNADHSAVSHFVYSHIRKHCLLQKTGWPLGLKGMAQAPPPWVIFLSIPPPRFLFPKPSSLLSTSFPMNQVNNVPKHTELCCWNSFLGIIDPVELNGTPESRPSCKSFIFCRLTVRWDLEGLQCPNAKIYIRFAIERMWQLLPGLGSCFHSLLE